MNTVSTRTSDQPASPQPNHVVMLESHPGHIARPFEGERNGIALCLSGGGFRAALFHLGAMRWLHEVGILQQVRTISSVSGGSILAGYLAGLMIERGMNNGIQFDNWEREVAQGFRENVAGRDLRTIPMVAHTLWNWALPDLRVRHMVQQYARRLTAKTLGELPKMPEFVFCATDMVFGVNWEFHRDRSGDWLAGYTSKTTAWPIAMAVAASACFPPLFGPMSLNLTATDLTGGAYHQSDRDQLCSRLCLSDGGVYDNLALEPAWKSHKYVLISDCGAPFQFQQSGNYTHRLLRYTGVVMNQAQAMRKRVFFDHVENRKHGPPARYKGAYWGIGGTVDRYKAQDDTLSGYSQRFVDDVIDRVRTDLDRFSLPEMQVLENHGYLLAAAVLKRRWPEWIAPDVRVEAPHKSLLEEGLAKEKMRHSHRRFSWQRLCPCQVDERRSGAD